MTFALQANFARIVFYFLYVSYVKAVVAALNKEKALVIQTSNFVEVCFKLY